MYLLSDQGVEKSLCLAKPDKDFFIFTGRRNFSLAFTKKEKGEITAQYEKWLSESQAIVVLTYKSMTMKEIDAFRAKVRESNSEVHLVKNTLFKRALASQGYDEAPFFEETSLVGFAFNDAPALAKTFTDATKGSETTKVKGGYLGKELISDKQIKALADLPPLPVMRATLLGTISAPATKLVRTLAEPARSLAAVIKAYSDKAGTAA
ncbi:MAG: 50S ribosomal protein L10 [Chloroflexi bacterium HGW-Chloroflexi-7]|nr:MAG: 50S ribosomal protein L10 [Chloroflexi bacterium HGW-Chloroflexi-7]